MDIKGWKYYNHAAIPTTSPHEDPDLTPLVNGDIWKLGAHTPLFARWTTNFDCGYETNWWYVLREGPFSVEDVPAKERKSIRQALRKSYAKRINPLQFVDELYSCYVSAVSQYDNDPSIQSKENFLNLRDNRIEFWAGFDIETDKLIGYMTVAVYDIYVEIRTAKFDPEFFKSQVSDTIYLHVLEYYLNECEKKYVSSGSRNINHKTGTQEYKIRRFGYRKAYCNLHIEYNPKIKWIIKLLFPFRKLFLVFDKIGVVHQLNSVLKMEELCRSEIK